jgi:hypothetical protein
MSNVSMIKNSSKDILLDVLYLSLQDLVIKDFELIKDDVSERAFCSRLAYHIQSHLETTPFHSYFCDVEYNRMKGQQVKVFEDDKEKRITCVCDLLIHSRGSLALDNLLCMEVKKEGASQKDVDDDKIRVRCLTKPKGQVFGLGFDASFVSGYLLGVFLSYNRKAKTMSFSVYSDGKQQSVFEESFDQICHYVSLM